ncbi:MAG: hypothetical protein L6R48_16470 [Planctomycetes bacterium]|nr:hypothetical protein [Planctomycetota bacterium]
MSPDDLPDVLTLPDGRRAPDVASWNSLHRPELLAWFCNNAFGSAPTAPPMRLATALPRRALPQGDGATIEEWRLHCWPGSRPLHMAIIRPPGRVPAPCVVGLNFTGNHSLVGDPGLVVPEGTGLWGPPVAKERGLFAPAWCWKALTARGWALATAFYGEIEPDPDDHERATRPWDTLSGRWHEEGLPPCGAIGVWAWLLSRLADVLTADPAIDADRLAVVGHSRLGKAALWAAAQDRRFAAVVPIQSGCGGAAPVRGGIPGTEQVADVYGARPGWFVPGYAEFGRDPTATAIDHHHLIACCAPRSVMLCCAEDDPWSNPLGQFAALHAAAPAWTLLGAAATPPPELPPAGSGGGSRLRWWWRIGPHDQGPAEWAAILPALAAELNQGR